MSLRVMLGPVLEYLCAILSVSLGNFRADTATPLRSAALQTGGVHFSRRSGISYLTSHQRDAQHHFWAKQ
jgi:hypothetical protein